MIVTLQWGWPFVTVARGVPDLTGHPGESAFGLCIGFGPCAPGVTCVTPPVTDAVTRSAAAVRAARYRERQRRKRAGSVA